MAGNLTRDEALERSRLLTVDSYAVELDLTTGPDRFTSTTVARFHSSQTSTEVFVDLADAVVREVTLNGSPVDPALYDAAKGRIPLAGLAGDNELRVVADCAYSRSGQGLHRFTDPADDQVYLYSQFATADAHRVFACFDQPDLKAAFAFTVTAPAHWQVVCNTAETACTEVGEVKRWSFPASERISTYLAAVCAGPYHVVADDYEGRIPLRLLCRASLAEHLDAEAIFDVTRRGFGFYERAFDMRYPFGKYDQVFVPEFNFGAMENPGCVTFREQYVFRSKVTDADYERRATTILHEMAHMWFGDLVTMRWWDDLWLNESFATYAASLALVSATRWSGGWASFADRYKGYAYQADQFPSTHPIVADIVDITSMEVNFDAITYHKGASVLKQLIASIGLEDFLAGLRLYFQRHAWGNTTLADLLRAVEEKSGRDLAEWSDLWLRTAGPNTLRPEFTVDSAGRFSFFAVTQSAPSDYPTLRPHRIAIGLYDKGNRRQRVELEVTGARTEVAELVGVARPDLVLLNDDDLTYAKIRLDPESLAAMLAGIGDFTDPLPQAVCWTIAWDMTRDAELPARDYVSLVLAGVPSVDVTIARTLLHQARVAAEQYTALSVRGEVVGALADGVLHLARSAEAGGEEQLVYMQSFAAVACTTPQLDVVAGLLDGSTALPGLDVDADLRWSLLLRLVVHGRAGVAEIEAELRRDATASGERSAAACRAALSTAKAQAWERIVSGELSNEILRSTLAGFQDVADVELLAPYAEKYFAALHAVSEVWPTELTRVLAKDGYPSSAVSEETLALTDAYLAEAQPPWWLRRLVLESGDELKRTLRAQNA
ncbi:aminopeptidase N [Allokutzneria sp. A3M-2-11 16]|uniref:aminopeptidase N n=1 Tax=Allokutzneria sp. A3M-2-11 16 TaxID=2962043 RepID=UPI0020B8A581|nr:aminopeptidase N [Allokutzneria sp. A3M-2-11 16]MCP3802963.1 aminopeptidase N [Allokutzneria sp. A3M-2-11 16]